MNSVLTFAARSLNENIYLCLTLSVYLSSIRTCPQLFPPKLPSLFWFIFPRCSLSLTCFSSFSLPLFPPFPVTVCFPFSFCSPCFLFSTLLLSSLSCWRGCWRRFRIWRPQFCLRRRESVTWRISFPSTPMALTDRHAWKHTFWRTGQNFSITSIIETRFPYIRKEALSLIVWQKHLNISPALLWFVQSEKSAEVEWGCCR